MEFLPRPGPGLKRGVGHSNREGKRKLKSIKQTLNSEFWYRLTVVFFIKIKIKIKIFILSANVTFLLE